MKLRYNAHYGAWLATGHFGGRDWIAEGATFEEAWDAGISMIAELAKRGA